MNKLIFLSLIISSSMAFSGTKLGKLCGNEYKYTSMNQIKRAYRTGEFTGTINLHVVSKGVVYINYPVALLRPSFIIRNQNSSVIDVECEDVVIVHGQ